MQEYLDNVINFTTEHGRVFTLLYPECKNGPK